MAQVFFSRQTFLFPRFVTAFHTYGIDRLVEELIRDSMAKGDFNNLRGSGKPLKYQTPNPFVDTATQKINQILIENGFTPQWITLENEIRSKINDLKEKLKNDRALLGRFPLAGEDAHSWNERLNFLMINDVKAINKKIDSYNLVVPILSRQMAHVNFRRLADKCLKEEPSKFDLPPPSVKRNKSHLELSAAATISANSGFLGIFYILWKWKPL